MVYRSAFRRMGSTGCLLPLLLPPADTEEPSLGVPDCAISKAGMVVYNVMMAKRQSHKVRKLHAYRPNIRSTRRYQAEVGLVVLASWHYGTLVRLEHHNNLPFAQAILLNDTVHIPDVVARDCVFTANALLLISSDMRPRAKLCLSQASER